MIETTHKVKDHGSDGNDHNHGDIVTRILGSRAEVIFAVLAGVCLLIGWLGPKLNLLSTSIGFVFLVAAYVFGGYFALREAVEKLLKGKFQIDFLMLVAAAGAAFLGEWAEGAFLLFLLRLAMR